MSSETALWVGGVILIPAISWSIAVIFMLTKIHGETKELLKMHKDPEKFGLGPGKYADIVAENTRAIRSLTHYIKWLVREQMGKTPPPPLEGGATGIEDADS